MYKLVCVSLMFMVCSLSLAASDKQKDMIELLEKSNYKLAPERAIMKNTQHVKDQKQTLKEACGILWAHGQKPADPEYCLDDCCVYSCGCVVGLGTCCLMLPQVVGLLNQYEKEQDDERARRVAVRNVLRTQS